MIRVVIIAVMAVVGFAALARAADIASEAEAPADAAQEAAATDAGLFDADPLMRMCVGPARLSFGGAPFIRIAFGGEDCGRASLGIIGVQLLDSGAARSLAPAAPFLIEDETDAEETGAPLGEDAARAAASRPA